MEIEWDEAKRREVIARRGVDLLKAARIFEGKVMRRIDGRADYGETRYRAVGMVGEDCFVLVFTERGAAVRLITAWKGGRSERQLYKASIS